MPDDAAGSRRSPDRHGLIFLPLRPLLLEGLDNDEA